jgi:hypothetical protein
MTASLNHLRQLLVGEQRVDRYGFDLGQVVAQLAQTREDLEFLRRQNRFVIDPVARQVGITIGLARRLAEVVDADRTERVDPLVDQLPVDRHDLVAVPTHRGFVIRLPGLRSQPDQGILARLHFSDGTHQVGQRLQSDPRFVSAGHE